MAELRWGTATDPGRVRPGNEDSVLAVAQVFAVADGMGGHAAGEVASAVALQTIAARIGQRPASIASVTDVVRAAQRGCLPPLAGRADDPRHGHDARPGGAGDRRRRQGPPGRGQRGRQPRLPLRRRRAAAADPRPQLRRGDARRGSDHRGRGPPPPPSPRRHEGRGDRAVGRRRHVARHAGAGRPLPRLLRRARRRGDRRGHRPDHHGRAGPADGGRRARHGSQRGGWSRQHQRRRRRGAGLGRQPQLG